MNVDLSISDDAAYALSDALSYYLSASAENFGSGTPDEADLAWTRAQVKIFMDRLDNAFPA